jgi:FKBP-type peptidyl-prolyl cis-trans isomerase
VPSNKQRRDAERLRLQRQLEQRREREIARRRTTLVISIVGTLALVGGVIAVIAAFSGGSGAQPPRHHHQALSTRNPTPTSPIPTPEQPSSTSAAPPLAAPKACIKPAKTKTVKFDGVSVGGATDLKHAPKVTGRSSSTPNSLECRDLVVGKGKPASPTSSVTVQYTGVLYKDGKVFDSSWTRGKPATFSLNRVVPGFTQGIGGTGKVAPMRVGGRRIMILPPALGYGAQGGGPIPPNATLVFVVDLLNVSG